MCMKNWNPYLNKRDKSDPSFEWFDTFFLKFYWKIWPTRTHVPFTNYSSNKIMENCSILPKSPRMRFQYQHKNELQTFNNFSKDFLFSIFALSKSLVTLHVVLSNFVWCQADSLCVTQLCPHLAEKCKLRIKTKHGRIYFRQNNRYLKIKYMFCLKDKCVGFISHNHWAGNLLPWFTVISWVTYYILSIAEFFHLRILKGAQEFTVIFL